MLAEGGELGDVMEAATGDAGALVSLGAWLGGGDAGVRFEEAAMGARQKEARDKGGSALLP